MTDKEFGIPEQKKFPLDTRAHVISAIKFFNYADPQYRKALAQRIIRKIHEYGITGLTPSDQNAFYNYYHPKTITHSGGDIMSDYYAVATGVSAKKIPYYVKECRTYKKNSKKPED